jgi:hypothetical protein
MAMIPSVKQTLRQMLKDSMLVAFPLGYKAKKPKDVDKLVHLC